MTAPQLLQAEMPLVRRIRIDLAEHGYTVGTAEYTQMFNDMISFYRKFGWTTP